MTGGYSSLQSECRRFDTLLRRLFRISLNFFTPSTCLNTIKCGGYIVRYYVKERNVNVFILVLYIDISV